MKTRYWIIGGLFLLFIIGGTLAWTFYPRQSPFVDQAQQLANKMMDENLDSTQRRDVMQQLRQLRETVPEAERREVFRAVGEQFRQNMDNHMREFAKLPEDQRDAFLDRDIDRWEAMREDFEKQRAERRNEGRGGPPGGGPGPGDGPPPDGGRDQRQAGGERGGWGPRPGEDRDDWRRRRLDNSTPEQRALRLEYFTAIMERRKERGLEPMPFGPPGRGRR